MQGKRCFGPIEVQVEKDGKITYLHKGWASEEEALKDFPKLKERGQIVKLPQHRIED